MKIAIVSPFPPFRGGIAQFSNRLAMALSESSNDITGISFSLMYPSILFPGTSQYLEGSGPSVTTESMLNSIDPFSWFRTRSWLSSAGFDRIVFAWWHPFFSPCLIAALPGKVPSCAICHNIFPHEHMPLGRALTKLTLRKADLLVTHSMKDYHLALSIKERKGVLKLFHPVYDQYLRREVTESVARQRLGFGDSDRVVLFFGLIRPYKGIHDLVDAVSGMPDSTKLLIVGEPYEASEALRERLSQPDIANRSTWIDHFVEDDMISVYFQAADVVALPYRTATQSGVSQIALAFHKPLVVTSVGGLPEVVENGLTGFVSKPANPEDLRVKIMSAFDLCQRPGIAERIEEKARSFGWDAYAARLVDAWS